MHILIKEDLQRKLLQCTLRIDSAEIYEIFHETASSEQRFISYRCGRAHPIESVRHEPAEI